MLLLACWSIKASINGVVFILVMFHWNVASSLLQNSNEMQINVKWISIHPFYSIVLYMNANTELSFLPAGGVAAGAAGVEDGIITIVEKTFTC